MALPPPIATFLQTAPEPESTPVTRVTRRLKGTDTYELETGVGSTPLVLTPMDGATRLLLAEVLPGGHLIRPLVEWFSDGWQVPRSLPRGRPDVFRVAATPPSPLESVLLTIIKALRQNLGEAKRIRQRASKPSSVLLPCLELYDRWVSENPGSSRLERLTDHLLGAKDSTAEIVRKRSKARHAGAEAEAMSVINSMRRSAGTNYQSLVALALAEELASRRSNWYVAFPPPIEYTQNLALRFKTRHGFDVEIDPDIDILIRNAQFNGTSREPIVMLSIKTSLADRAGSAARWKMYFDVATHECPFDKTLDGCAWSDQGLRFAKPSLNVDLSHCIVTANIYKVGSDQKFAAEGELGTAQTKSNTFMFDRRYATRLGDTVHMDGWEPLTEVHSLLEEMAGRNNLAG